MNKQKHYPSKLLLRIFRWFCHPDYVEDIEGDLLERFEVNAQSKSSIKVKWMFFWEILKLFRPELIRPIGGAYRLNHYGMLKTMLTVSWRNAIRHKQFTTLNLLGLSLGIATCLMIGLYVFDELSYDTFHEKADRIYRINQPNIWGDWDELSSSTGPNVAIALKSDAPEFQEVTRLLSLGAQTVSADPELKRGIYQEEYFYAAEENFMKIFSFEFLAGDRKTALSSPNQMLITLETAGRYFGEDIEPQDLIDKTVKVKNWEGKWETFMVKGILKDIPSRSHLQFDVLVSLKSYQEQMDRDDWKWIWTAFSTYGLVHEGIDIADLERNLQAIPPKWAAPTTERIFNQSYEEFTAGHPWILDLQPLDEIYISGNPDYHRFGPTGNPLFVKIFGAIGLLVLLLSTINFMNLSTARSSNRAKEVGIRKVLGSAKRSLLAQFILESTLYVLVGAALAFVLVFFSLDTFNFITDKEMDLMGLFTQPLFIGLFLIFIVILGLLAGSYPAFYLSSFKPALALKGKVAQGFKGKYFRNGLIVFQFTISIALIICSSFVQKQLSYASTLDVGFEKQNILQLHNIEQFGFDTKSIEQRLSSISAFDKVGKSFGLPPNIWSGDRYKAALPEAEVVYLNNLRTDEAYLDLLGLDFLAGRNYDPSRPADKYKVIINESAAKILGWGDQADFSEDSPIGKKIAMASGDEDEFEVIGVVKDFNFNSLRNEIAPMVMIHYDNDKVWDYGAGLAFYSMRLNSTVVKSPEDLKTVLLKLEREMAEVDPTVPFEYSFMDQEFEKTFRFEEKMGLVLNIFTVMALVIGCLGLFGLAAFSAEQRTKELGIRKILGARISELVISFSSEFTRLVGIAVLIACPIAWFSVDYWLSNFAYRTALDPMVFIFAIAGALTIAIGTIAYQSLAVANRNPVDSLRDE